MCQGSPPARPQTPAPCGQARPPLALLQSACVGGQKEETEQLQLPHLLEPLGEGINVVLVVLGLLLLDYHLVKLLNTPQVLGHYSTIWNDLMIKFETESESE